MDGYGDVPLHVWDDNGIVRCPGIENKVSWIIRIVPRDGVRKPAARVVVSVKYIFDAISGFGSPQTCPENLRGQRIPRQCDGSPRRRIKRPTTHGSHIWVVDPEFDIEWADRVDDNDGVLMNTGHGIDQVIAVRPSSQIIAVSILQSQRYALQS